VGRRERDRAGSFFVYRAAQRASCVNEVDSLAAFAERVYRTFEGMPWEGLHTFFAQSLGEILLRTFVACWHVDEVSPFLFWF
jgi:hypothetical protein